jgi:hypothetical protein
MSMNWKRYLDDLLKVPVAPSVPEKITTYGGPDDAYTKIVETFTFDDEGTCHINRAILYKNPVDHITMTFKVGDEQGEG